MRHLPASLPALAALAVAACSEPTSPAGPDAAIVDIDAAAQPDAAPAGFGALSGMCGSLAAMDFTSTSPLLVRATFTFSRAYVDSMDRSLLTAGGRRLAETPNAGGSSGLSEVFAYEQLERCEQAALLKTETEIVYTTAGKITDLEVFVEGTKVGVSVVRAMTYPFGNTYTPEAARTIITRKLNDIQASSANVSPQDKWEKQILAVLAWDSAAADTVAQVWAGLDASVKSDTILLVTDTNGEDLFIYTNQ